MRQRVGCLVLFVFAWLFSVPSWAQTAPEEQDQLRVKADSLTYEEKTNTVTATGNVVVTKGDTTVNADSIGVNRTTNEVSAQGNVIVQNPQGEIKADALQLDMENETGEVTNGTVRLPRNQYVLAGKRLQKSYGQSYHIEDGAFTTCNCESFQKADWSISGKTVDVTMRGKGEVYGGVFRVRDVPLVYLPYGVVPVNNDRQSGFLFPHYGFSSKRGFQWEQPFYWAINKSNDVTVTADLETAARLGVLGEYRYAPSENTEGQFLASYFNEQIGGPATTSTPVDRWSVTGTHRQKLTEDFRFYSDLFFVSDDLFLREINLPYYPGISDSDLRSRRFTDSHVGGMESWDNALLRGEASYYQDLQDDQDFAFQVLPRVQFQGQHRIWQDRIETGLTVDGANFYRNQGYAGQRLDVAPSAALPFHLGDYAFGSVKVTGRETAYFMSSEDQGQPPLPQPGRLNGDRTRETVQVNAQIGTRFSRVFDMQWGRLLKLQHVVEPEVGYLYVPFVEQDDLPLYDSLDRINKRSLFVYGVSNRFLGKFATSSSDAGSTAEESAPNQAGTEIRELARLDVTHAYDPNRALSGNGDHFSGVDIGARLTPVPYATLTFDSTYDLSSNDVSTTRVGAFFRDPRPLPATSPLLQNLQRSTTIGVSYRTISERLLKEIDSSIIFRLNDRITTAYIGRYDLNAGDFIGNRYFIRYFSPQQCWFVDLGLIDKVNPHELEFRFIFSLIGLSSSGRLGF